MLKLCCISVETTGHCVWDCDQQEVWHDHHDLHRPEHAHHDPRPLRAVGDVGLRPREPQHGLHLHLLHWVLPQNLCSPPTLLQRALEYFWFCCCYFIHSWWVVGKEFGGVQRTKSSVKNCKWNRKFQLFIRGPKIKVLENWTIFWWGQS